MYCTMGIDTINLLFIGHFGTKEEMAGVGMGEVIQNMTGLSLMKGMNSAIETLVSQARGVKKIELCGVYMNRGRFVTCIMFIPCILILS